MTTIKQADFIQSIADALQHISYYHPVDYIHGAGGGLRARAEPGRQGRHRADPHQLAHVRRRAPPHLPGYRHRGGVPQGRHERAVGRHHVGAGDGGRRRATARTCCPRTCCARRSCPIRRSRGRTRATTRRPWCTTEIVPGDTVEVKLAAKGGGSENKSKFAMLNPSDSIVDWVMKTVPTMGAGWCPPGMLGIGIGGTAEKAMLMAKESLMEHIDMAQLKAARPAEQDRGAAHRAASTRSMRWASARRDWAGCRPCSTSRSSIIPRTPRPSRSR